MRLLVCALLAASLLMNINAEEKKLKRIVEIAIPKCGTHLVNKCLHLLGKARTPGSQAQFVIQLASFAKVMSFSEGKFWVGHLVYKVEYAHVLSGPEYCLIFMYRDPRDHVVSYAYHMKKRPGAYPKARAMTISQLITDQLTVGAAYGGQSQLYKNVDAAYKTYLPWMALPNVLCVCFEDLVGSRGGGSDEIQCATIKSIADHVEVEVSDLQIQDVMKNLFGPSMTFREGMIGSWKKHFTEEQKELFKKIAGQLLIDLGYEQDLNW